MKNEIEANKLFIPEKDRKDDFGKVRRNSATKKRSSEILEEVQHRVHEMIVKKPKNYIAKNVIEVKKIVIVDALKKYLIDKNTKTKSARDSNCVLIPEDLNEKEMEKIKCMQE